MSPVDIVIPRKIGRNDRCPCGSGLKFKRCCLGHRAAPPMPLEVQHAITSRIAAEERRRAQFGEVRPIIQAKFNGHRFIAVGNRLHYHKDINTFPDFLMRYIAHAFGSGWGNGQLAKPLADRHPVMKWYAHVCDVQKRYAQAEPDGLFSTPADGVTCAYLHLAYDLYVLDDHQKLQKEVLRRLRRAHDFPGARYELFVAATFVRAGFDIAFEDETDSSRKHPEFVATHRATGFVLSVEAKARNRPPTDAGPPVNAGVRSLLEDAIEKETARPYAVFVDVNLPPDDATGPPAWAPEVHDTVNAVVADDTVACPFDLVFFTNIPHQYGEPGGPDPAKHFYAWKPPAAIRRSRIPVEAELAIVRAITQYGNLPQEFG